MSSANYYDQQIKPKKKDQFKMTSNQVQDMAQMRQSVLKSQQQNYEQNLQNTQQSLGNQGGVSYVKQVASKGATGRKGSLPLNYAQVAVSSQQAQPQGNVLFRNNNQHHRSSQQYIQNTGIETNMMNQLALGNGKGINKSIKSHAKYFSQQNSPVAKDSKASFHQNQPSGQGGIILSTSGAGIIGVDNQYSAQNTRGAPNQQTNQASHHTTGNFGSNPSQNMLSSLPNESRHVKNYSQISQQSQQSNMQNLKHMQYMQQLMQNENNGEKPVASNKLMNPTHMKQVHSIGGPVLSQFAGNQTIQSNGSNTQPTQQTFNASLSLNKTNKIKQQYEDSYLNGPLNATSQSNINKQIDQQSSKRAFANQSQQQNPSYEMGGPQLYGNHKRVVSSQMSHINSAGQSKEPIRSSTATGNYHNNNNEQGVRDSNYNQKQLNTLKQSKLSQHSNKLQMEKSQEFFQKSGNQLGFMNTNSIVLHQTQNGMKKKQMKAQTRPNSNQKIKSNQMQGESFVNTEGFAQHPGNQNKTKPKTSGTIKSAQNSANDRNKQRAYHESHQMQRSPLSMGLNNTQKHNQIQQIYSKDQGVLVGSQNLVYYGMNSNLINSPNEMHVNPSQSNIPILQGSAHSQAKGQPVMTVPQTMMHKSSKIMNNYIKQSEAQLYNKRMSTDQMIEKDAMNMSLKKQPYHHRAETQLKNPHSQQLMAFGPNYDPSKDDKIVNSNSNQFLVQGQHQMINTQHQFGNNNKYSIVLGPNQKIANSKSQKSSTSRLINHSGTQSSKFSQKQQYQKAGANYPGNPQIQNSADRIAISQRSEIQGMMEHHINSENYDQKQGMVGGVITTNSSKKLLNQPASKLSTIQRESHYIYQSNSTKSGNYVNQNNTKNNLSIAQIFQQKGLSYKGPSKLSISSNNNANSSKLANRIGPNGVIVHTKGGLGVKGSLTTSANTAQNSPRQMSKHYAMNQISSNNTSIRKKPSTASITGVSNMSQPIHKKNQSHMVANQIQNSNLRTTSHGGIFKKISQQSGNNRMDSPIMYQDDHEDQEMAHLENTVKMNELDSAKMQRMDDSINQLPGSQPKKHRPSKSGQIQSQIVGGSNSMSKKQLIIGTQPSTKYIADNGGTGSNPNISQGNHTRHISQHEFYSQNIQAGQFINPSIPQKKNQHSNSLGNMQQLELLRAKHMGGQASGPHPTPKMDKHGSQPSISSQSIKNKKQHSISEVQKLEVIDDEMDQGPLITEEEEMEIRQVASDINEKAFYGKVLKAKRIIEDKSGDTSLNKLSPRSKEIAFVMKNIHNNFSKKGEAPETQLNYYRVGKMLGRGAFGKVNLAMHKLVRKLVALKSLNKECLTDEVQKHKLMKEVNLLLRMRNDHVVKIYETIETKKHIIIVMELCAGGDLLNYVRKRRRLKEPFAKKIFKQIIEGLQYIHSKYVGHRDIKLDNILLDGKGSVKIADFGVSKQCQPGQKMREQCGTPAYIAPEILKNKNGYSFGVDLWSAGVVLFAMLYGTVPFKAASMEELHSLILRGIYTLKDDISQEARDMLRGLLEINPHKRLTIPEILNHAWLKDYDSSLQLFNDQEREMIKKEYTYNDPSRYNRNENEEPVDCFTEHNIDSVYNTLKNASEKSIILAPFNSTQSEDYETFKKRIKPMMFDKNLVLRLSRLCREIDRQYEFNNNGQLDNGVYHKQVNNTAENDSGDDKEKKDSKKKSPESDDEDEEAKFQVVQCDKTMGQEFLTEDFTDVAKLKEKHGSKNSRMNEMLAMHQSTMNTREMIIDHEKVERLVQFGYPYEYIVDNLTENLPNYLTAGYYLLQMDQNYC